MTKYPGQLEKIQSGMKWADEDQRDEIGNLAAGGQIASMMGVMHLASGLETMQPDCLIRG